MKRQRRVITSFAFSIQALLGLIAVSALLMWSNNFKALVTTASIVLHYSVLATGWSLLARASCPRVSYTTRSSEKFTLRFTARDTGTTLRIIAFTYLVIQHLCNFYWLTSLTPTGWLVVWHTPVLGAFTLAQVNHCTLAAFSLLLVTLFVFPAYAGSEFSRRVCIETSVLLTLLLASHAPMLG